MWEWEISRNFRAKTENVPVKLERVGQPNCKYVRCKDVGLIMTVIQKTTFFFFLHSLITPTSWVYLCLFGTPKASLMTFKDLQSLFWWCFFSLVTWEGNVFGGLPAATVDMVSFFFISPTGASTPPPCLSQACSLSPAIIIILDACKCIFSS